MVGSDRGKSWTLVFCLALCWAGPALAAGPFVVLCTPAGCLDVCFLNCTPCFSILSCWLFLVCICYQIVYFLPWVHPLSSLPLFLPCLLPSFHSFLLFEIAARSCNQGSSWRSSGWLDPDAFASVCLIFLAYSNAYGHPLPQPLSKVLLSVVSVAIRISHLERSWSKGHIPLKCVQFWAPASVDINYGSNRKWKKSSV